jgi:hypothetical protein
MVEIVLVASKQYLVELYSRPSFPACQAPPTSSKHLAGAPSVILAQRHDGNKKQSKTLSFASLKMLLSLIMRRNGASPLLWPRKT